MFLTIRSLLEKIPDPLLVNSHFLKGYIDKTGYREIVRNQRPLGAVDKNSYTPRQS